MRLIKNKTALKRAFVFSVFIFGLLVSGRNTFGASESGSVQESVWSGYWWPHRKGEMREPLKKYDKLTGAKSEKWEKKNNPSGSNVPEWYGYCHAWSAASVLETEPTTQKKTNGVTLTIGDQKGLLSAAHAGDIANFYGKRYVNSESELNDIRPDELWKVLRRYIKEEKLPVVLDVAPKEEVWNYPVFAYRVNYTPVSEGSKTHNGVLEVWLADDAVPRDFVGLKKAYKKYTFRVDVADGMIIEGTGEWTGDSQKDHPDFAWFPYIIKPENPELSYNQVCKILGRTQAAPVSVAMEEESEPETEPAAPAETAAETRHDTHTETESEVQAVTAAESAEDDSAVKISGETLLRIVEDKKSAWIFNVFPNRFDGGTYNSGESFTVNGKAGGSGYLYLFELTDDGKSRLIYPVNDKADNRVTADQPFEFPGKGEDSIYMRAEKGSVEYTAVLTENKLKICDPKDEDALEELSNGTASVKGENILQQESLAAPVKTIDVEESPTAETKTFSLVTPVEPNKPQKAKKSLGGTARDKFTILVTEPESQGKE